MNVNEMNVVELKGTLFDLDQEIKYKQNQYNEVIKILQAKLIEEQKPKEKEVIKKK